MVEANDGLDVVIYHQTCKVTSVCGRSNMNPESLA